MIDSPTPFDREIIITEAEQAFCNGAFLGWLSEKPIYGGDQENEVFLKVLVELHNTKAIDLLNPINTDQLRDISREDFWQLQHLYCSLIPELEARADHLMDAVERLVDKAGNDLAANRPNSAFRDWLILRPKETKRLLERAQKNPEGKLRLLTFILEAGAMLNLSEYQAAATGFLDSQHLENRLSGVTALGRIDSSTNEECHSKSLLALRAHAETANSDHEFAQTVGVLLDVYARYPGVDEDRVIGTIQSASKRPTPDLHFLLARSLGYNHDKFSNDLQKTIIDTLRFADLSMNGVIDQIDFAFSRCLNKENRRAIADCLQDLLDRSEGSLNFANLTSFIQKLVTNHPASLNWLIVHWLRFGSHQARLSLPSLFKQFTERGYELDIALVEFEFSDEELIFISRKALGYFVVEGATAASILISCLKASSGQAAAEAISELLFDPLMINLSGQARDVIERHAKSKGKRIKHLKSALRIHDEYLVGLKVVNEIPELWPSPSERQVQVERQRQIFARSFKDAEKASVFSNLVTTQTLLNGVGAIQYTRDIDGQLHRSESILSSHGTSIEFPRFEFIDPVYFQHLILQFRNEMFDQ